MTSGHEVLASQDELKSQRTSGFERRLDIRFVRLLAFITYNVKRHNINQIVFEDVVFTSSQAQAQLWGRLSATVWAVGATCSGVDIQAVPVQTLKVFATGHGNADKELMRAKLAERYPTLLSSTADDNEVDAVWLLVLAQQVAAGNAEFKSIWDRKRLALKAKRDRAKAKRKAQRAKISSYK